jgi:hypothetical protein
MATYNYAASRSPSQGSSRSRGSSGGPLDEGPFHCEWLGCSIAHHPFSTGMEIWEHLLEVHLKPLARNGLKSFGCRWGACREDRKSSFCLQSHMKRHLDWRPYGCEYCGDWFKHKCDHKKHVQRRHPDCPLSEPITADSERFISTQALPQTAAHWADMPAELPINNTTTTAPLPQPIVPSSVSVSEWLATGAEAAQPSLFYALAPPPETNEEHDIRLMVDDMLQGRVSFHNPDELAYYIQIFRQYSLVLKAVTLRMDKESLYRFSQIFDYAQLLVDGSLANNGMLPYHHQTYC